MLFQLNSNLTTNQRSSFEKKPRSQTDILMIRLFLNRLWQRVTAAIKQNDQLSATEEKTIIEDEQRKQIRERKATGVEWHPRLFNIDSNSKEWIYTYADTRPWDAHNDISTYENNFVICTRTRHRAVPMNHTNSSASRNNSTLNVKNQTSQLNRGPSPSLQNIRDEEQVSSLTPTNTEQTSLFLKTNDDLTSMLKRIETTLIRTNERLDRYERELHSAQKSHSTKSEYQFFELVSPYMQYILIIVVAIILKYIFK